MADRDPYSFGTPTLYVRHLPDTEKDSPADAHDTDDPFTGFVEVGVSVDGVDIPLTVEKAGWIGKRLAQAKTQTGSGKRSSG